MAFDPNQPKGIEQRRQHYLYLDRIHILIDRFPTVFNRENPLPLEIGVFEKLIALPDLGMCDDELEAVLLCWTSRREYCRSAALWGRRYDLNGKVVEKISDECMATYTRRYKRFVRRGFL